MKKYLLLASLLGLIALPHQAHSQADVIFGIMDHMMREGARQQQVNRERERQQQQFNRERERQQQETRRQNQAQIALVRRAQSALKTLGFYTMTVDGVVGPGTNGAIASYQRAFELPNRGMDENDVAVLESRAQAGFLSLAEERDARSLGFSSRQHWQAAKTAGFPNAREWDEARSQGVDNHRAWQGYKESGFSTFREFEVAQARGFDTRRALERAEQAGFDNAGEHEAFLLSGAENREAFLRQQQRLATAAASREDCMEAVSERDWARAVPRCEQAAGVLRDDDELLAARATAARQIDLMITTTRANRQKLQRQLDNAKIALTSAEADLGNMDQGSAEDVVAEFEATRDGQALELEELALELAAADAALARAERGRQRAACFAESMAQRWASALTACNATLEADPDDQDVLEILVLARAEREAERLRAEEERRAMALANARRDNAATIEALDAFAASGGSFETGLAVSRAVVNLQASLNQDQAEPVLQAQNALVELLKQEDGFQAFRRARQEAERAAQASALAEAEGNAQRLEAFIRDYLTRNVLSPRAAELLTLQAALEEALASDDPDRIVREQTDGIAAIDRLGLGQAARAFTLGPTVAASSLRDQEAIAAEARLTLSNASERAAALLGELEDFVATGARFKAAIPVARAITTLRGAHEGNDIAALEDARQALEDALGAEDVFVSFRKRRADAEAIAASDGAVTAAAWLNRKRAFIEHYIARNPLDTNIDSLLATHAEISDALEGSVPARLALVLDEKRLHLQELGLWDAFERHAAMTNFSADDTAEIERAVGGLAITALNAPLLLGEARDIVMLRNASGTAPFLRLNLRGDPVFDGQQANICWMHEPPPPNYAVDLAIHGLRAAGAHVFRQQQRCQPRQLLAQDLVLFERGRFLEEDPIAAKALVSLFEDDQFRLFSTLMWSDVAEETARQEAFVAVLREELAAGTRQGVGFIALPGQGGALCIADEGGDEHVSALNRHLVASAQDQIRLHLPPLDREIRDGAERIFARAGRNECGAIMAQGDAIETFIAGLSRDGNEHHLSPIWFEASSVAQAREAVVAEDEERLRHLAARGQDREGMNSLAREQRETAEARRLTREKDLRTTHAQEARGALNDLQEVAFAILDNRVVAHEPATLFPDFAKWRHEHVSGGWEFVERNAQLLDFGLASWSERQLEAVIVRLDVESRNPALGRYENTCLVIGYLIDTEFERRRDSFETRCAGAGPMVDEWRTGRGFASRWIANLED